MKASIVFLEVLIYTRDINMIKSAKNLSDYEVIIESEYSKQNQVGIDLSVKKIEQILDKAVFVLKDRTVVRPEYFEDVEISIMTIEDKEYKGWLLTPGAYALTFNEKCSIPADGTGFIQSRSSIYRGGTMISSPLWDPGFTTKDNFMGTTMIVTQDIFIEENSRVAQFFLHQSEVPGKLYDGQFQGKTNY
jgi:deoxycytidine triphosphate deaminase